MRSKTAAKIIAAIITIALFDASTEAQRTAETSGQSAPRTVGNTSVTEERSVASELSPRERLLLERIEKLDRRLAELERSSSLKDGSERLQETSKQEAVQAPAMPAEHPQNLQPATPSQAAREDKPVLDFLRDTTFNVTMDGYYGYNFNKPIGRINLLRAYDVQSNSFSLNQASIVIERAPNAEAGRRFGVRLDLMYGQATETVQGSAANEPRPQAYRPVWQAIGTYVAPIGNGLTLDFGKFASSLGYETNYTKDDYNYSRSYYFNFLPFYHFGVRAKYPLNDKVTVMYHLMNGVQQSEDFNGFKSQHFALILTPAKQLTWQVNYYVGQEQRDLLPELNPGLPSLPIQPGLSTNVIRPVPNGRLHIFDSYATWNVTNRLIVAVEGDYVVNRVQDVSAPSHIAGGVAYARYQLTPKFAVAARGEYLSDRGGLFSGLTQALKETTLTSEFKLSDEFLLRSEWRRDFSNQQFFLTDKPGFLKKEQNTATLGLIWWFGRKQGSW